MSYMYRDFEFHVLCICVKLFPCFYVFFTIIVFIYSFIMNFIYIFYLLLYLNWIIFIQPFILNNLPFEHAAGPFITYTATYLSGFPTLLHIHLASWYYYCFLYPPLLTILNLLLHNSSLMTIITQGTWMVFILTFYNLFDLVRYEFLYIFLMFYCSYVSLFSTCFL